MPVTSDPDPNRGRRDENEADRRDPGRVNTVTSVVSVAHMHTPKGGSSRATTRVRRLTYVLSGTVHVDTRADDRSRPEAVHTALASGSVTRPPIRRRRVHSRVRPAFSPDIVHRGEEYPSAVSRGSGRRKLPTCGPRPRRCSVGVAQERPVVAGMVLRALAGARCRCRRPSTIGGTPRPQPDLSPGTQCGSGWRTPCAR